VQKRSKGSIADPVDPSLPTGLSGMVKPLTRREAFSKPMELRMNFSK